MSFGRDTASAGVRCRLTNPSFRVQELRPYYVRVDQEGRTLLHELFTTAGDIRVSNSELHITLAPLSSPHRTHPAQVLRDMLDHTATTFPGSRLRIRHASGLPSPTRSRRSSVVPPRPLPPDRRQNRTFFALVRISHKQSRNYGALLLSSSSVISRNILSRHETVTISLATRVTMSMIYASDLRLFAPTYAAIATPSASAHPAIRRDSFRKCGLSNKNLFAISRLA